MAAPNSNWWPFVTNTKMGMKLDFPFRQILSREKKLAFEMIFEVFFSAPSLCECYLVIL